MLSDPFVNLLFRRRLRLRLGRQRNLDIEHASISPKHPNAITRFIVCDVVSNPRDFNLRPLIDWHRWLPAKASAERTPVSARILANSHAQRETQRNTFSLAAQRVMTRGRRRQLTPARSPTN